MTACRLIDHPHGREPLKENGPHEAGRSVLVTRVRTRFVTSGRDRRLPVFPAREPVPGRDLAGRGDEREAMGDALHLPVGLVEPVTLGELHSVHAVSTATSAASVSATSHSTNAGPAVP